MHARGERAGGRRRGDRRVLGRRMGEIGHGVLGGLGQSQLNSEPLNDRIVPAKNKKIVNRSFIQLSLRGAHGSSPTRILALGLRGACRGWWSYLGCADEIDD